MSLLRELVQKEPSLAPPVRFPSEAAFEAYMEGALRELLEERGFGYAVSRLPDGRFVAEVVSEAGRSQALSFSGWKALAKAYLSHVGRA